MKTASKNGPMHLMIPTLFLLLGLTLTGCGQRGPLYLPESEPSSETAATQTPTDALSGEEDDTEENLDG